MPAYTPTDEYTPEDAFGSGNEALIAQQQRIFARQKLVDAQTAQMPKPPEGQMVSGRYVKPSFLQQLQPVVASAVTQYQQAALNEDSSLLDRRIAAAKGNLIARAATAKSPQEKAQIASAMYQVPGMEKWGDMFSKDTIIDEPDRVAARADKKDTFNQQQAQAAALAREKMEDARTASARADQTRRDLAQQHGDLMTTLKGMGGGGGGGGDKAANYQIFQDKDGNLTRVNKLTGQREELGAGGREASGITKANQEAARQQGASTDAIEDIGRARKLLKSATGSKIGSIADSIASAAGVTTEGAKASAALTPIAESLVRTVPRFEGPQSDADVKRYQAAAGRAADPEVPVAQRLAALDEVERMHRRTLATADRTKDAAAGKAPTQAAGASLRDSIEAAAAQHSAPTPKVRTYNPATGRLE